MPTEIVALRDAIDNLTDFILLPDQAEEPIGERLSILRKNGTDAQRASAFRIT